MIKLSTPRGIPVDVPEALEEDPSPRFEPTQLDEIRTYYDAQGYVVVRGVFDAQPCETIRSLWESEVKPSNSFIYRQATAKAERHSLNDRGWVMNPILNLQSVDPRRYPRFREYATSHILSARQLSTLFRALLDDRPKVVQSMYFEGNSATWEHQDTYYLDSENIGRMAAAWIALEDISPRAGRFFICPGSHKLDMGKQSLANNIADNHDLYIRSVVDRIVDEGYEIRAPRLDRGDVLFWNALTVHGSLDSQDTEFSRSSITCHAIPARDRFLQFQVRAIDLPTTRLNDTEIYRPKDLTSVANRAVLWAESRFPGPFYALKRAAIRHQFKKAG